MMPQYMPSAGYLINIEYPVDNRKLHDRDYINFRDCDYRNLLSSHYADHSIQIFMEECRLNINPKIPSDDVVYFPEFNLGIFDEKMKINYLKNFFLDLDVFLLVILLMI